MFLDPRFFGELIRIPRLLEYSYLIKLPNLKPYLILPRYSYNIITTIIHIIRIEEKKRRRALTNTNRLIIRKRNQTHALGTQQELIDWFITTTGNPLSQSQVSKVLGS